MSEERTAEARVSELEWEVTRLVSALENWGRHHPWCAASPMRDGEAGVVTRVCNCGLTATIDAARAQATTEEGGK